MKRIFFFLFAEINMITVMHRDTKDRYVKDLNFIKCDTFSRINEHCITFIAFLFKRNYKQMKY